MYSPLKTLFLLIFSLVALTASQGKNEPIKKEGELTSRPEKVKGLEIKTIFASLFLNPSHFPRSKSGEK